MRLSLVIHVTGLVVRVFGLMFLAPLAVALLYREYRRRDRVRRGHRRDVRGGPPDAARRRRRRRGGR